tara:strand:- start:213 stop:1154 length:942 start_codon:yes stop_codon:yes gene_type:complete
MINLWYDERYWNATKNDRSYMEKDKVIVGGESRPQLTISPRLTGPEKVVINVRKSLELAGINYTVNENKYRNNLLLQYDGRQAQNHAKLEAETCVIGPQVWVFEPHGRYLARNPDCYHKLIAPCKWVSDFFRKKFYLTESSVGIWAVGIDEYDKKRDIQYDCLLYTKRRSSEEVQAAKDFLKKKKLTYKTIEYGLYNEEEFLDLANQAKFCFLVNGTESQGIAVQEIMSLGVPLFVWDLSEWLDMGETNRCPATSVPYWDGRCGEKFYTQKSMSRTFTKFNKKLKSGEYDPKSYVKENLSHEVSVKNLLSLWD